MSRPSVGSVHHLLNRTLTRSPFDGEKPWSEVARYVSRRLGPRRPPARYRRHDSFWLFAFEA